jgi:uracil-DNA glycosylase
MKIEVALPPKEIIQKIEELLIQPDGGIGLIYEQLLNYHEKAHQPFPDKKQIIKEIKADLIDKKNLSSKLNQLKAKDLRTLSIDFPLLLKAIENASNKPTIFVVAMDPLAPNVLQSSNEKSNIGYWVPFSLIDSDATGVRTFQSNRSFFNALLKHYNVYITDIYKLFYRLGEFPQDFRSNADKDYTSLEKEVHLPILTKELQVIQPKAIVTLGNKSRNALYNFQGISIKKWDDVQMNEWKIDELGISIPMISIPHISGAANGASSQLLNKYPTLSGNKMEKIAQLIHEKINSLV